MRNNLTSQEKTVLSTWKSLLKSTGASTTDYALRSILLWVKSHDFLADGSVAFSISSQNAVGEKLWEAVSRGDKEVQRLETTWCLLFETLKQWKKEQEKAEGGQLSEKAEVTPTEDNLMELKEETGAVQKGQLKRLLLKTVVLIKSRIPPQNTVCHQPILLENL